MDQPVFIEQEKFFALLLLVNYLMLKRLQLLNKRRAGLIKLPFSLKTYEKHKVEMFTIFKVILPTVVVCFLEGHNTGKTHKQI